MNFYWVKTNRIIKKLFPKLIWDIPNANKTVFLTFDDGPTPTITPWVLDVLRKHQIKATFFCIGDNIRKYPEIFKQVIAEGHTIGNHTFNHLKGWKTETSEYIKNFRLCETEIYQQLPENRKLFRPPYGKIKRSQSLQILESGYKIIMWDVLTADYDKNVSPQKCLENATKKTTSGSIIIFHDSIKAFSNVEFALPETIRILKEKGFSFDVIR
ncbi:MAG: polysaccharide deacetylase family protein [Flavobacterium sp.]|nr:polysaccharide deacetylase family protein [Flavobacterium sp.]